MKLVFATHNQHKLHEVQLLVGNRFPLLSLEDIHCDEDIEETAVTLKGNAELKADFVKNRFGFSCFADDTGLEVEALGGKPGVYSARYAGANKNDEDNMALLLQQLKNIDNRNARFVTFICLSLNNRKFFFEGELKGTILTEKRGANGFGYDPVFVPEGGRRTLAEMSTEEKNAISHRAKAFLKLQEFLTKV